MFGSRQRREQRAFPALASAALLAVAWGAGRAALTAEQAGPATKTYKISIEGLRFDPPTLIVNRGDYIEWVNKDPFPHTVTSINKTFDSKDIGSNASWTYIARAPGDYSYGCTYHPTMKGQFIVR